tara:strand:- start:10883 stop:12100 length:1218 start_codon:yes stop_codon:yes gene_type:complete
MMKFILLLFLMLCSCEILDDVMNDEVDEIGLTLWLDKPYIDGYFRVKYDLNKESDYYSIEYITEPMTRVFWYSYDYYTMIYWGREYHYPIVQNSTYSSSEDGSGKKLVYLSKYSVGDTLEVMGYIDENNYKTIEFILATGHSARDIFELLYQKGIAIEAKAFAFGVRVEHTQELIDQIQYKCKTRGPFLPPAPYSITKQISGRGVYSFCMCPGGIIAPCATSPGEVVTNGWSPSKRDYSTSNSGIVVELKVEDFAKYEKYGPLAGVQFQKEIEQSAWELAGGTQRVPAQRLVDYTNNILSTDIPKTSYIPGTTSAMINSILPEFIAKNLQEGLRQIGKQMKGYFTNEAVVNAPESRTSSPVRIPRDSVTLEHSQIEGLYPCGEGAGYAGGIISAAIDREKCAKMC